MLSLEAIVAQVWQRIVPTDWKIIRGKRRSAFALAVRTASVTLALLALLLIATGLTLFFHPAQLGLAALSLKDVLTLATRPIIGYPALVVGVAGAGALALLVGLFTWVVSARRHAGDPDPVIVLLPTGFVEYVSQRKPIIGILYADVAAVEVGQGKKPPQTHQPGAASQPPGRSNAWLHLRYHDGSAGRWRPRANFGPPEHLYETLIKAHALYDILYGSGR